MNGFGFNSAWKIGNVEIPNRAVLAPMAGYTDYAMRRLFSEFGAGLTVTEMVSAKGLCYNGSKSAELLKTSDAEKVKCAQLFGHEPEFFYEAIANLPYLNGFDIIDINMGCPVPKIVNNGDGSALINNPKLAAEIVAACVKASKNRPVTVKTRSGFNAGEFKAVEFCKALRDAGAAAVTIHGRTRATGYSGFADVTATERVKNALDIPVIHSGDADESNAESLLEIADAVAFGRGAIGNPRLFMRLTGKASDLTIAEIMTRHIDYMAQADGERYAYTNFRKHIGYYLKGVSGAREIKTELYKITDTEELKRKIKDFFGNG